jgi:MoaA/NifB/PqqE/SkfB family radical SAM enzyme
MAVDALKNKFSPCCFVDKSKFSKYKTIESYYESPELKNLQNNLLNNIEDNLCQACWKNEKNGVQSMRQSVLQDRSKKTNKITQVKLHVGSICNLACMMCFPSVSTTWNKLWRDKNYPETFQKNIGHKDYDQYIENYIKENINNIQYIETLGGEPLFSKRFISLLEWIINNKKSQNITLYIITNLTILPKSIIDILSYFKKVVLTVSLEGIGKVNDYIRWGSDFQDIDKNIKKAKKLGFHLSIQPTISSLNLHRLHEIYQYSESLRIPVLNLIPVHGWTSLKPINLPVYLKEKVSKKFKKFLIGEPDNENILKNFIITWDKKRNISIVDYMPEFEEFIK